MKGNSGGYFRRVERLEKVNLKKNLYNLRLSSILYSSVVDTVIIYVMVCTHPDISLVVSVMSRYMTCPGK